MAYFNKLLQACFLVTVVGLLSPAQASPSMPTGAITSQPVGHHEYCARHAGDCKPVTAMPPLHLTPDNWKTIVSVNSTVNVEIDQRSDMEVWGYEDYWEYPYKGAGDCDDIVLEKRKRLMDVGLPASNLLITVVRDERGDGHAVLTVRTDRGDFILDNMKTKILRWDKTPYTYLKRQSVGHAGRWVDVDGSGSPAIAAREVDRGSAVPATTPRRRIFSLLGNH